MRHLLTAPVWSYVDQRYVLLPPTPMRISQDFYPVVANNVHLIRRMINIWSGGIVVAPYLAPMVEAFITWKASWRWSFLVYSLLNVVGWFTIVLLADETWYDRSRSTTVQPRRSSRVQRLLGVAQRKAMRKTGPTFMQSVAKPSIAISKIPVLLAVIYYFINFAWGRYRGTQTLCQPHMANVLWFGSDWCQRNHFCVDDQHLWLQRQRSR